MSAKNVIFMTFLGEPAAEGENRDAIMKEASEFLLALNDRFKAMDHHVQVTRQFENIFSKDQVLDCTLIVFRGFGLRA